MWNLIVIKTILASQEHQRRQSFSELNYAKTIKVQKESILTSVPNRSPTDSLPPRKVRYCSPSSSQVSSIQEVFTDSEAFSPTVKTPAPSPQNCSRDAIKLEPLVKITTTMDWKEAEKVVVDKFLHLRQYSRAP